VSAAAARGLRGTPGAHAAWGKCETVYDGLSETVDASSSSTEQLSAAVGDAECLVGENLSQADS
jgi:hypothetical protein